MKKNGSRKVVRIGGSQTKSSNVWSQWYTTRIESAEASAPTSEKIRQKHEIHMSTHRKTWNRCVLPTLDLIIIYLGVKCPNLILIIRGSGNWGTYAQKTALTKKTPTHPFFLDCCIFFHLISTTHPLIFPIFQFFPFSSGYPPHFSTFFNARFFRSRPTQFVMIIFLILCKKPPWKHANWMLPPKNDHEYQHLSKFKWYFWWNVQKIDKILEKNAISSQEKSCRR